MMKHRVCIKCGYTTRTETANIESFGIPWHDRLNWKGGLIFVPPIVILALIAIYESFK